MQCDHSLEGEWKSFSLMRTKQIQEEAITSDSWRKYLPFSKHGESQIRQKRVYLLRYTKAICSSTKEICSPTNGRDVNTTTNLLFNGHTERFLLYLRMFKNRITMTEIPSMIPYGAPIT